jgi:excisionase family DNA binding protein
MRSPKFTRGIQALVFWFEHGEQARQYSLPAVFLDENDVATTPPPQVFDYPDWWYVWVDLDIAINKLERYEKKLISQYFLGVYEHGQKAWYRWRQREEFKLACASFFLTLPIEYRGERSISIYSVLRVIKKRIRKGVIKLEKIKPDYFYTAQEVAYILRYSDQTIHELLKTGRLKGLKVGQWRIKGSHLLEFINQPVTETADE